VFPGPRFWFLPRSAYLVQEVVVLVVEKAEALALQTLRNKDKNTPINLEMFASSYGSRRVAAFDQGSQ